MDYLRETTHIHAQNRAELPRKTQTLIGLEKVSTLRLIEIYRAAVIEIRRRSDALGYREDGNDA